MLAGVIESAWVGPWVQAQLLGSAPLAAAAPVGVGGQVYEQQAPPQAALPYLRHHPQTDGLTLDCLNFERAGVDVLYTVIAEVAGRDHAPALALLAAADAVLSVEGLVMGMSDGHLWSLTCQQARQVLLPVDIREGGAESRAAGLIYRVFIDALS